MLNLKKWMTKVMTEIKTLKSHSQPIIWMTLSRENITQNPGANYWQLGSFPAKTGYTRTVLNIRPSKAQLVVSRWGLAGDNNNNLVVYLDNLASSAQTFDLLVVCVYIKDSEKESS